LANRRALQLPGAFRARQFGVRPRQRAPDLLMLLELTVRLSRDGVRIGARLDDEHSVDAFLAPDRRADNGGLAHAVDPIEDTLDVLGEDVQPLGRDDHFLLAPADVELTVGRQLADVAGVEPAVLERLRRLALRIEVAARDVLAADEDLT